jgi:hypothetical protein|nr:MAG TPA: DAP10 membrane protein [Herelleviridae sp.]
MITFGLLVFITVLVIGVVLSLLSVGGTIFIIIASDIIVAIFILWLIYHFVKKKK